MVTRIEEAFDSRNLLPSTGLDPKDETTLLADFLWMLVHLVRQLGCLIARSYDLTIEVLVFRVY